MENVIVEDKEGVEWVTSRKLIYKDSLNFVGQVMVVHHSTLAHSIVNYNVLSADREAFVECVMFEYLLNIPPIITTEIRQWAVKEHTTLLFPSLIYQLCMDYGVPVFPDIDHMITNIRMTNIALIKYDLNLVAK
ncbi:hypothetical protein HAX54_033397, partial [Datura stramonium]|nr:hypothetical protein [Datura stramonium]